MYDGKKICSIEAPNIAMMTKINSNRKNLFIYSPCLILVLKVEKVYKE